MPVRKQGEYYNTNIVKLWSGLYYRVVVDEILCKG